jgi:hypothetical protein
LFRQRLFFIEFLVLGSFLAPDAFLATDFRGTGQILCSFVSNARGSSPRLPWPIFFAGLVAKRGDFSSCFSGLAFCRQCRAPVSFSAMVHSGIFTCHRFVAAALVFGSQFLGPCLEPVTQVSALLSFFCSRPSSKQAAATFC